MTVNNAAVVAENLKLWEIPNEIFDDVIDTNMKGVANMLRHFIPLMLPKNKGIIVNVSSLYGRIAAARVSISYAPILILTFFIQHFLFQSLSFYSIDNLLKL